MPAAPAFQRALCIIIVETYCVRRKLVSTQADLHESTMAKAQMLALILAASTASASLVELSRSPGARRALLADDHDDHDDDDHSEHEDREPFIQSLGAEDPLGHLLELYTESMSTEDAVAWHRSRNVWSSRHP